MQSISIVREIDVIRTPRLLQMEGVFDVPPSKRSKEEWTVNVDLPDSWNVGLIVGPSGSGKTTVATELFGKYLTESWEWPKSKSIVDGFPDNLGIKEITELLCSVGFSSPPSWVRPFHVLSNGEQFRVNLARTLAESPDLAVVDEFTSVVDRTVAQVGSAAVQKTVRRRNQKFVAVSCHYDIIDWLEPDWIYQPHTNEFYSGRYLYQRPKIELSVKRVHRDTWQLFRKHHYLDTHLHTGSVCFCAFWNAIPVAFTAILHFPHSTDARIKREHRTVCLPDYQGVGIGNALSDYVGAMLKALGYRFMSQTSHPSMIAARNKSKKWAMIAKPNRKTQTLPPGRFQAATKTNVAAKRYRATFEYCGSSLDTEEAKRVYA